MPNECGAKRQSCSRPHCPNGAYGHSTTDYDTEVFPDGRRFHACRLAANHHDPYSDAELAAALAPGSGIAWPEAVQVRDELARRKAARPTVTRQEWEQTHPDYKLVKDDGTTWMLRLGGDGGTILERVVVADA